MEGYCFKCRDRREIQAPEAVLLKNGNPATRGTCPVCTGVIFRMGRTPAHSSG